MLLPCLWDSLCQEDDQSANPVQIALFGAVGIMLAS
jgi:hypothetical protein